jgi:glycosyltransferase involved in cell wall biosynthesis
MKTYLVLPAYNESQRKITALVNKIGAFIPLNRIIIVDDGSKKPIKIIQGPVLLRHNLNLGKGAALKTGCRYAFRQGAGAIIMMDSDGQHNPKEIPHFLTKLASGCEIVFGSRLPSLDAPLVRLLGNKFASIYINLMFRVYISDTLSGFRAFTRKAYRSIRWSSSRYGVETEMIARLGKNKQKLKFCEIPIETIYLDNYKGVTILDAINILMHTIWWKLS